MTLIQHDFGIESKEQMNGSKIDTSRFESVPYSKFATDMELDDLTDVNSLSPNAQQVLTWDGSGWVPADIPEYIGGTGIEVNGNSITNTLPDQEISLTGAGNTSITGTYPDFIIESTGDSPWSSATSGIFYNGNIGIGDDNPNSALSIGPEGVVNIYETDGDMRFSNPQATIQFSRVDDQSAPMIEMFSGGTNNRTRMVIAHSPAFREWGLRYNDTIDAFTWIGNSNPAMHMQLAGQQRIGFGTELPEAKVHILENSTIGNGQLKLTEEQDDYARITMNSTENDDHWDLAARGGGSASALLNFYHSDGGNILSIGADNRVGINDLIPNAVLDVRNDNFDNKSLNIVHNTSTTGGNIHYGSYIDVNFSSSSSSTSSYGLYTTSTNTQGAAVGVFASGSSSSSSTSVVYGVRAYAVNDNGSGMVAGIFSSVGTSSTSGAKYAGYFAGDIYASGSYLPSDAKLKDGLTPSEGVLDKVLALEVENYTYRKKSFASMELPEGNRIGFTAQNVKQTMPELVKSTIQPATTEEEIEAGIEPSEEIRFEAVNYTGMIPYLVKSIQEQQEIIESK